MPISQHSVNYDSPRHEIASMQNVARTISMTSLELVEFINDDRKRLAVAAGMAFPNEGYPKLLHKNFLAKVPEVLGETSAKYSADLPDGYNRPRRGYILPKREACLMAMSYSYELQAAVYDHMTDLEERTKGRLIATLPDFSNPAAAARAWAEQFELRQAANEALAIAAPKAEFVDNYVTSTGLKGFRQTAKLLRANEARFHKFLLDKKIMYRMGGEWQAYQPHIDAGRFDVKTGTSESGHAFNQTKFTPKGVTWVAGLWAQYKLEAQ
jgi:phage antirepressor YoqD-like protein